MKNSLFPILQSYIEGLDISTVSKDRKVILQNLIKHIIEAKKADNSVSLNFICTHNSRRSHMGQIWAQTMAEFCDVDGINSYSGGTESTALYPEVVKTLGTIGFTIKSLSESKNPIYSIKNGENSLPIIGFSKTYDDDFNPKSNFAALMMCGHADENCPFIVGANARIALNYEDPKEFDNSDLKAEKYLERSAQIATEMKYVFQNIKTA